MNKLNICYVLVIIYENLNNSKFLLRIFLSNQYIFYEEFFKMNVLLNHKYKS